jgi:hypothetical protein
MDGVSTELTGRGTGLKARPYIAHLCIACSRSTIIALGLLVASGCARVPPLASTHPAAEEVAKAVLDAIERRDRAALERLALSETEFRDHVWPDLPASRPERNLPFAYVWGDLRQKSHSALQKTLREHGGRPYRFSHLQFAGETEYRSYTVHRETTLTVVDGTGRQAHVRLFGSLVEKDGAWKVFSYVVDD